VETIDCTTSIASLHVMELSNTSSRRRRARKAYTIIIQMLQSALGPVFVLMTVTGRPMHNAVRAGTAVAMATINNYDTEQWTEH